MSNKFTKQYTAESKESAVKLAVESDQTIIDTARELGANISALRTWIKKHYQPKQSTRKVDIKNIYNKNKRLRKEIAHLKSSVRGANCM